jgi:hypothetical protein
VNELAEVEGIFAEYLRSQRELLSASIEALAS